MHFGYELKDHELTLEGALIARTLAVHLARGFDIRLAQKGYTVHLTAGTRAQVATNLQYVK